MSLIDQIVADIFGGPRRLEKAPPEAAVPMLSHWLPYRSYDPRKGLYHNSASRGFSM